MNTKPQEVAQACRDEYLETGASLIQQELDNQANFAIGLQDDEPLQNIDILSDNLLANKSINQDIKQRIAECSGNIQKFILATAFNIENKKYEGVENSIKEKAFKKFQLDRMTSLFHAQKQLSGSFQTLSCTIDIFKIINNRILEDLKSLTTNNGFSESEYTNLLLKNAILVYELTKFTVDYLEQFSLQGYEDLIVIRDSVFADLARMEQADKTLESQAMNSSASVKEATLVDIQNRREIRSKVKNKWDEMIKSVQDATSDAGRVKGFIADIKVIRDNAKGRIDIIQLVLVSQIVENTIKAIQGLSDISAFRLADFDVDTAVKLLNIN